MLLQVPQARAQQWLAIRVGNSKYIVNCTVDTQKNLITTGLTIYNRDFYDFLWSKKEELEKTIASPLIWHGDGKSQWRIFAQIDGDIGKVEKAWAPFFDWCCAMAIKFAFVVKREFSAFDRSSR